MKKALLLILIFILVVVLFDLYFLKKDQGIRSLFVYSICDKPITYKIGSIDSRFNITSDQLLKDTKQAADIWNRAYTKTLFVYDPQSLLSINMVFDERQSLNNQINQLKSQLDANKNSLKPQEARFQQEYADFKKRLVSLNSEIESWNKQGGAPEDIYNKIQQERFDLIKEADKLNQMAKNLNISAENFNSQVANLNQKVQVFNAELEEKPEEGKYLPAQNRIEIYFNITDKELVHTLAHELGHARGLDHNQNPKSIMFPNTTLLLTASETDIKDLSILCAEHTIWEFIKDTIDRKLYPSKTTGK